MKEKRISEYVTYSPVGLSVHCLPSQSGRPVPPPVQNLRPYVKF